MAVDISPYVVAAVVFVPTFVLATVVLMMIFMNPFRASFYGSFELLCAAVAGEFIGVRGSLYFACRVDGIDRIDCEPAQIQIGAWRAIPGSADGASYDWPLATVIMLIVFIISALGLLVTGAPKKSG